VLLISESSPLKATAKFHGKELIHESPVKHKTDYTPIMSQNKNVLPSTVTTLKKSVVVCDAKVKDFNDTKLNVAARQPLTSLQIESLDEGDLEENIVESPTDHRAIHQKNVKMCRLPNQRPTLISALELLRNEPSDAGSTRMSKMFNSRPNIDTRNHNRH
jgi:hypothetical protein